jgi:DNA-binding HxlR family transcriptional regulator
MGKREYDQSCSLACALDRIGERWSMLIVRELSLGPLRFSDLVGGVGGAPTDVLTKRLRDLESHGIVRRRELAPPATGTVYELTDVGWALERPMLELARWGLHFERVDDVVDLAPTSLPGAIRTIAQPPPDARLTVGLRSGGRDYWLRIESGWIAAGRGEVESPDVTLGGEPADVLAALVVGEAAEDRIEIEGSRRALAQLRAMIVMPERLRQAALALVAQQGEAAAA